MLRQDDRLLARARRKGDALWLADLLGEVGQGGRKRPPVVDYGGLAEHHLGLEVAA